MFSLPSIAAAATCRSSFIIVDSLSHPSSISGDSISRLSILIETCIMLEAFRAFPNFFVTSLPLSLHFNDSVSHFPQRSKHFLNFLQLELEKMSWCMICQANHNYVYSCCRCRSSSKLNIKQTNILIIHSLSPRLLKIPSIFLSHELFMSSAVCIPLSYEHSLRIQALNYIACCNVPDVIMPLIILLRLNLNATQHVWWRNANHSVKDKIDYFRLKLIGNTL